MNKRLYASAIIMLLLSMIGWGQTVHYDTMMSKAGLVDVSTLGPGITVQLKYATTDNFTGKNMYGTLQKAYLQKAATRSLQAALKQLQRHDPNYGFIIYDAARPLSVQRKMWEAVRGTAGEAYVARPARGGPHNYGIAIDISLTYKGVPVDMGTPFDTFTTDAHITNEAQLVMKGRISIQAIKNRQLLRKVLTDNGFLTYSREWWHFEHCRTSQARRQYKLLNF